MPSEVTPFTYLDTHTIRVVKLDREPWMVARDVLDVLGIKLMTRALANIGSTNVKDLRLDGGQRGRPNKLINEAGFYKLVLRSDKPEAKPFQDWVAGTVLPAIRIVLTD